jgi:hypothetical protein
VTPDRHQRLAFAEECIQLPFLVETRHKMKRPRRLLNRLMSLAIFQIGLLLVIVRRFLTIGIQPGVGKWLPTGSQVQRIYED